VISAENVLFMLSWSLPKIHNIFILTIISLKTVDVLFRKFCRLVTKKHKFQHIVVQIIVLKYTIHYMVSDGFEK